MKGAKMEVSANTSSAPTITITIMIGRSHHFFRTFKNLQSSPINPLIAMCALPKIGLSSLRAAGSARTSDSRRFADVGSGSAPTTAWQVLSGRLRGSRRLPGISAWLSSRWRVQPPSIRGKAVRVSPARWRLRPTSACSGRKKPGPPCNCFSTRRTR